MSTFTTEEMNDITTIFNDAVASHFTKIMYDIEQGVFTAHTEADLIVKIAGLTDHTATKAAMVQLGNDLSAGGQIVNAPPAFTTDELHQMSILDSATKHPDVVALSKAAGYVLFWSDGQMNALLAAKSELSAAGQAAVDQLNSDLIAGSQILPDPPIVGIHHHHHHDMG